MTKISADAKSVVVRSLSLTLALSAAGCAGGGGGGTAAVSNSPRIVLLGTPVNGITTSNFLLTLSANILPPTVNNVTLTADDIFVTGTNAYISYNIPGATHMGAIDQVSLALPLLPSMTASTTFADTTVNGVYVSSNKVYAVGSTTATTTSGWPAILNVMTASANAFTSIQSTTSLLNTYSGTAVTMWNNALYALSGTGGNSTSYGLSVINPTTLAQTASLAITDARGMAYYYGGNTDLFVIAGGGNLYDITTSNTIAHTIAVGGNTIAESKSTVQVGKTMVAVTKGDQGAAIVCQADQKILATIPAQTVSGLDSTLTVTNGIAAGPGLLFVANGEAGVYVYTMVNGFPSGSSCNSVTLTKIGVINLQSQTYSSNTLRYYGGSLFVASGLGGLNAITITVLSPLLGANLDFM